MDGHREIGPPGRRSASTLGSLLLAAVLLAPGGAGAESRAPDDEDVVRRLRFLESRLEAGRRPAALWHQGWTTFLALAPWEGKRALDVSVGVSAVLFLLGGTSGVVGCALMWNVGKVTASAGGPAPTAYPAAADPAAQAVPSPPCATCHRATRWIPEYERWYCDACQRYV